jgi:ankyrin repeat protein
MTPSSSPVTVGHVASNRGTPASVAPQQLASELFDAVRRGDGSAVAAVLSRGAAVTARDADGWTPVHTAAWMRRAQCLRELLSHGAGASAAMATATQGGRLGLQPVHMAAMRHPSCDVAVADDPQCLQLLTLCGVDVNAAAENGSTALMLAAACGHVRVVSHLLSVPTVRVDAQRSDGYTAEQIAEDEGHADVALLLHSAAQRLTESKVRLTAASLWCQVPAPTAACTRCALALASPFTRSQSSLPRL